MVSEFKKFLMRGNVVDLAIAVIIGGAFGKIVSALVDNIIMPPIGMVLGKVDFANLMFVIRPGPKPGPYDSLKAAKEAGAVVIGYGEFLNTVISFLIIGLVLFAIVRTVNQLLPTPPAPDDQRDCPRCLAKIPKKASKCSHCTVDIEPVI